LRRDGTPKPAFTALTNLIQLLSDSGTDFPPDAIQFWTSDRDVRHLVLEKEDGTFWIALWRNLSLWDTATQTAIVPAPAPVTLGFLEAPESVLRYEPSVSVEPEGLAASLDVTVDVGASLVLLALTGMRRGGDAVPSTLLELDDLSELDSSTQVSIDHTITAQHDFDDGLIVRDGPDATITYFDPSIYDFALRTYFFCQGCVDPPLAALTFEASSDSISFSEVEMAIVDHQLTLDARETATFVPISPIPHLTTHLRIRLGPGAPFLGELRVFP
jgi:hypothetical protein